MINYLFGLFIIVGIVYGFFSGNIDKINDNLLISGENAIDMIINLIPLLCLWMGIMKIAEDSGLIRKLSLKLSKIIVLIFPELSNSSPAIFYIATSMIMNMLGLGNGATPFGIKAMEYMQKENTNKEVATRSMITFLVINTASITLIPTTVISIRRLNGSIEPEDIIFACIITTIISCFLGLLFDRIFNYIWRKYD